MPLVTLPTTTTMTSMKTPDYHNPQNVDPSNLNPGERFLLREEVGASLTCNCTLYLGNGRWGLENKAAGSFLDKTYKTTLPLPPEYREPDYGDPEYQRSVEQAFRDGKRVQYKVGWREWLTIGEAGNDLEPYWSWSDSVSYRIHPDDIDKEIDWKTPEKQSEVRRMWAENPAMARECKSKNGRDDWALIPSGETWRGSEYYYRPAQKPREKSQEEIMRDAFSEWYDSINKIPNKREAFIAGWNAREDSRKGVA